MTENSEKIFEIPPTQYDAVENITVNIWLTKGVHHFIQCVEPLFDTPSVLRDSPFLCSNGDFG